MSVELVSWDTHAIDKNGVPFSIDEARHEANLRDRYGMSLEEYYALFDRQGGVCAICLETCSSGRRLAVDHDHETGHIRGLLCGKCNRGAGLFDDDPSKLYAAALYLEMSIARR